MALTFLSGCDPDLDWTCTPGAWQYEVWSTSPDVFAGLREGCGFPDSPTDYQVFANNKMIIEGSLEHFQRRHAITELPGGRVEIAIWDRSCVVSNTGSECTAIDYNRWR